MLTCQIMKKKIIKTEEETYSFAKNFIKSLKGGDILGLIGDLGAGKTTFTKRLAKELGIRSNITSPTFVFMKVYDLPKSINNIKKLCHIDAYRISSEQDLFSIGADEYINRSDTLIIIEWIDKIEKFLPSKIKKLNFTILNNNERQITSVD